MIAYLRGNVISIRHDFCILDVGGVGYKVFADSSTLNALQLNSPAEFFIHTAVKDDAINLFGFQSQETLDLFELLLTVSGIGAKGALVIISNISPAQFAQAVVQQDLKTLMNLPGVGKKSAQRILLELKDKVKSLGLKTSAPIQAAAFNDAYDALEALGYTPQEISTALESAPPNSSTDQLIKFALNKLSFAI